jgi:drug/metabolite transporter (DMT)-like permease
VPRATTWSLYGLLVLIWSSTWVAIRFGLEDTPPLLGAGVRFLLAGVVLLGITAARRRPLGTDLVLATLLGLLPFAFSYGLIYWAEQSVPSGLAAVLFGVMPLYVALLAAFLLPAERIDRRLIGGVLVAIAGLAVAFGESVALGEGAHPMLGAAAMLVAPMASAAGNIAIKRRGAGLDPVVLNGWAMAGGGLALLALSAPTEDWASAAWTGQAFAAIAYLALAGSALTFVVLTILLGELPAVTMSYIPLLLPFGALVFGAALYDETITIAAAGGALLVGAGLLVAQWPARGRRRAAAEVPSRA